MEKPTVHKWHYSQYAPNTKASRPVSYCGAIRHVDYYNDESGAIKIVVNWDHVTCEDCLAAGVGDRIKSSLEENRR